jgi:hypothetical protein
MQNDARKPFGAGGTAPTVCLWVGLGKPVGKEKHAGGQLVTMREIH